MTQGERYGPYRLSIADITLTVVSVESVATQQNIAATGRNSRPKEYIFGTSSDTVSNFIQVHGLLLLYILHTLVS